MIEKDTHLDVDRIINRLKRIEGQIRGVSSMMAEGRRCDEIITQLSAVNAAITGTAREILYSHIEHCVNEIKDTRDNAHVIEDLKRAVESFGKLK
jgi:DNA-binding FrmR family transcriptional regulator